MNVDDAVAGAPQGAVELSLFEHRHMADRLFRRPLGDAGNADTPANLAVSF